MPQKVARRQTNGDLAMERLFVGEGAPDLRSSIRGHGLTRHLESTETLFGISGCGPPGQTNRRTLSRFRATDTLESEVC
jgi:hypothetical protein